MKFNWGTGIFAFYGLFVILMLSAVLASRQHKPKLVQNDYYMLDIGYQKRLDAKNRTHALRIKPKARFENGFLIVEMPNDALPQSGSVLVYRGGDDQPDIHGQMTATPVQRVTMPENVAAGKWHVELQWSSNGDDYYYPTTVVIP